jgi:AcrR family transcriptional regulator
VGIEEPRRADRRVQRTHRLLREALIALTLERGWDAISVQDVCDRADVGRSTFYTHFADKEDVLVRGLDDLQEGLRQLGIAQPRAGARPLYFTLALIEHAQGQWKFFRALIGKRSGQTAERRFRLMVTELVREDLTSFVVPGPRFEAVVHYIAGAFFDLLSWWLDSRSPLQATEVDELFHRLTESALSLVRAAGPPHTGPAARGRGR